MMRIRAWAIAYGLAAGVLAAAPDVSFAAEPALPDTRRDITATDKARVEAVTRPTGQFQDAEPYEAMQGGAATSVHPVNADAFSHMSANLSFADEQDFKLGNALFRKLWVSSPSSTQASDGLGPLFNARACQSCHLKDGRGHPPQGGDRDATSMFLRLARPAETPDEQAEILDHRVLNFPDPVYGEQLQDLAVPGLAAEGRMVIAYKEEIVTLADGTPVRLRKPTYSVSDLSQGPISSGTTLSPRIAPPMIGLGLVEAIHEADILAHADPDDRNGDGISGKAALVHDAMTGKIALGRFGWKAQTASVREQSARAFSGDIGISTPDDPRHFGDCTEAQVQCRSMSTGVQARLGDTEAPSPVLDLVAFYSENLAVPARRKASFPDVLKGKELFYDAGCVACHIPKFVTRRDAGNQAQAFQLIWPYSDFLLHDMGDDLADGQDVGVATGREWRTPPLWGIGLTRAVNGHTFFLHDGRARNFTEAILWHGGEAEGARNAFSSMAANDRQSLITFLESL